MSKSDKPVKPPPPIQIGDTSLQTLRSATGRTRKAGTSPRPAKASRQAAVQSAEPRNLRQEVKETVSGHGPSCPVLGLAVADSP